MSSQKSFREIFSAEPDVAVSVPGRVNLIGEHLDYNGGVVLPTVIARKVDVEISSNDSKEDHIFSQEFGEKCMRPIDDRKSGHWSDYVAGALAKCRALGYLEIGLNVWIESDVPHGSGLSSSAALIVAVIKAVLKLSDQSIEDLVIAQWAQQVEHDFIGIPCGIMDQMAVAIAREGQALQLHTDDLSYALVDLPTEYQFAILHSGISRKLNDGRYAERRAECEAAAKALDSEYLCHLGAADLRRIEQLPQDQMRRARHCVTENLRVKEAVEQLQSGDMAAFGKLMNESHNSMRDDFEVSTFEIDALVTGARRAGAIGARLTGGGFGGCIVACVAKHILPQWKDQMALDFPKAAYIGPPMRRSGC